MAQPARKPKKTPAQKREAAVQKRKREAAAERRRAAVESNARYEREYNERTLAQRKARAAQRNQATFPRASDVIVTRADGTISTIPAHKTPGQLRKVVPERLPIPPEMRAKVLDRDGHACRYCGSEQAPFEMDHVLAVARGGATSMGNLVTACGPCNSRKGTEYWEPKPLVKH